MSSSNCCFLTCIQVSQEAGQVVWYSHLLQNFPQFIVIHTVKGFGVVNKAEIDVFLELSCFFDDPADVGNLISGSSAFSNTTLNIWKFTRGPQPCLIQWNPEPCHDGHPRLMGHGGEFWQNTVHWRREWQTTSVFLPWEPHEQHEKAKEPEIKLTISTGSSKKQENSRKTSIFTLLTTAKPSTVWITINCGKFWRRWEYQTTWPASWETCMWVRKNFWRWDRLSTPVFLGFPGGSVSKEFTCNVGDLGLIPGLGRPPGGGPWQPTPIFLPEESPWTEEHGGLQSKELQSQTQLSD